MKTLLRKLKKAQLSTRLVYYFISLVSIIGYILLFKNLLLLSGVETLIRIIILVVLGIINILYIFSCLLLLLTKKNKTVFFLSFIMMLVAAVSFIGALLIDKTFGYLSNMNHDTIIYTTDLITLNDTEFRNIPDFKVGIIEDSEAIDNILAKDIIKRENLKVHLVEYENSLELIEALYDKDVDGIFIRDNYTIKYSSMDNYMNIQEETTVKYKVTKELANEDKIESTGSVDKPFTVLLMGVDSTDDELKAETAFNGDTLMILAFNPKTLNATVFSIPRDTFVSIYDKNNKKITESKINSSAAYGTQAAINTVENFLGIEMDYYVKMDFKAVVDLVDSLGGIDITVPPKINFCEQNSKRSFAKKDLQCIKSGFQHMNGEQALAFARHRKTLPTGDFQRVQHQQLVVESIANSAKQLSSIDDFLKIIEALSNNVETNMKDSEMVGLYGTFKNILLNTDGGSMISLQKTYLSGYDLNMYVDNLRLVVYTFQYYPDSLKQISDALKITLEQIEPEMIKTFDYSINETYEIPVVGKGSFKTTRKETLPNFVGQSIDYAESWATSKGISVSKNYITTTENENNTIIKQNVKTGTVITNIKSITFDIAKNE